MKFLKYLTFVALLLTYSCTTTELTTETKILGCTNPTASNYNPIATEDDGSCTEKKKGCTDKKAINFDPNAEINDGSCNYDYVVINYFASTENIAKLNVGMTKSQIVSTLGINPLDILHSNDNCMIMKYEYRDKSREFDLGDFRTKKDLTTGDPSFSMKSKDLFLILRSNKLETVISDDAKNMFEKVNCFEDKCYSDYDYIVCVGCTDKDALNYNKDANIDDGSCEYRFVEILGCTDSTAANYYDKANTDDKSCVYCPCDYIKNPKYDPKKPCEEICILDPALQFVVGCTDPKATNYNKDANKDDGSCVHCPCETEDYYYKVDDNRNCQGDPCIKVMKEKEENTSIVEKDCDLCDVLDVKNLNITLKTKKQ